ncbi:hypothetical protein XELAEV_18035040mg [Xenopus laevis]|uniref:Uncharacterized protein n=1 Tax=Xenopus laevis TaxID=8355 RepID=A0A974HBP5_XENLA|nr:hypothetical protein XELAEV_18035040mg [Xenopus laevis]
MREALQDCLLLVTDPFFLKISYCSASVTAQLLKERRSFLAIALLQIEATFEELLDVSRSPVWGPHTSVAELCLTARGYPERNWSQKVSKLISISQHKSLCISSDEKTSCVTNYIGHIMYFLKYLIS